MCLFDIFDWPRPISFLFLGERLINFGASIFFLVCSSEVGDRSILRNLSFKRNEINIQTFFLPFRFFYSFFNFAYLFIEPFLLFLAWWKQRKVLFILIEVILKLKICLSLSLSFFILAHFKKKLFALSGGFEILGFPQLFWCGNFMGKGGS